MAMTASQRRILTKTENEIRGTDPRLAVETGGRVQAVELRLSRCPRPNSRRPHWPSS